MDKETATNMAYFTLLKKAEFEGILSATDDEHETHCLQRILKEITTLANYYCKLAYE